MSIPQTQPPVAEIVRTVFLDRKSGVLEIERSGSEEVLFFRDGELLLHRSHPAVRLVEPHLDGEAKGRPAAVPELRNALVTLAHEITRDRKALARFREESELSSALVGPLPTVVLVMETAVHGLSEADLVSRLGGASQRYQPSDGSPALTQLPGLEPDMANVLAGLVQPASVGELLRGAADRQAFLKGLAKLRAVGLVAPVGRPSGDTEEEVLSPRLLQHFTERVREELENEPLALGADEHRQRLADLVARFGDMSYYELLDVGLRATQEEVLKAYNRLARVVHPSHAAALGLEGREEGVRVLFEKATEAYLVLSDPRRRSSYNMIVGIQLTTEVDASQRDEEKRKLARQNYRRATKCLAEMDYSLAVDLLKEAARLDPKPEYFARLGSVQAKNPHWHRHAVESYRRAVELSPGDAGIRTGYGEVLETMERYDEAKEQYKEALKLMPDHVVAKEGVERLRKF